MNFFGFSAAVNALTSLSIGIFVFVKNPKDLRNITFSLMCLAIFIWSFFYFLWQVVDNYSSALFFTRALMSGSIFIPVLYLTHILILFRKIRKKEKIFLIILYICAFLILISDFTPYFVKSVSPKLCFKFWPNPGLLYHPFLILWVLQVSYGLYITWKIYVNSKGLEKIQVKYFFLAAFIGWASGITNFFLWYDIPILPYCNILVSGFVVLIAYAILRHQLMDITIVIRKTAIYSIVATIITLVYFILIYVMEGLFRGFIGYKSIPWTLSMIIVFTLIFQPLKNMVQIFIDRHFFKGSQALLEDALKKAQDELRRTERLKAVGTLAAGMAHEIKNPLTGIKTFLEYLPSKRNDPEFIQKFHRIGGQEINKINNIVQQLLDFSKPKVLKLEKCDINPLLEETLGFLNNEFIKYRINIVKNYESSPCLILADCNQIKQVLLNLFLNSIDAMKQGGILTISTKLLDNTAEITIQDTGIGIPKKDLEHIFDPFYSTKETGTGLGMSIVYGIIKEHKGEISVESEVGKGTVFTVKLMVERII